MQEMNVPQRQNNLRDTETLFYITKAGKLKGKNEKEVTAISLKEILMMQIVPLIKWKWTMKKMKRKKNSRRMNKILHLFEIP